jgi:phosphatidylglycerol:prolipoprotein diacylglycerol transferase
VPPLAEIPYPLIDPILLDLGALKVRWYGVSYIVAFVLAALVLRGLARRGRFPVAPDRVVDFLFWGILGVFLGGRLGYVLFYGLSQDYDGWQILKVWEGGMSFHGGLAGVVIAYALYARVTRTSPGALFGGLSLATAPGLGAVRLGNFVNAELYGRPWDGPWAMRFPRYDDERWGRDPAGWWRIHESGAPEPVGFWTDPRHPSQLYEALAEGLVLYLVMRWLVLGRGWSGGRVAGAFLVLYGLFRFGLEFLREPDLGIGLEWFGLFTRGQALCTLMIAVGALVLWRCARLEARARADAA